MIESLQQENQVLRETMSLENKNGPDPKTVK
jgi:hypothetical protein